MCLYDLQYSGNVNSLEECMQALTSGDLIFVQDDELTTLFAKDVDEFHQNPQG